jgi:hypothetical protein
MITFSDAARQQCFGCLIHVIVEFPPSATPMDVLKYDGRSIGK